MPKIVSLLLGLAAVSLSTIADAETLKVAVAQRGFWDSTMVDIAQKQGFFKEAGLEIEILYTEGGASTLTPLLAGSIDIAMSNGILGVIGAYSKGAPVRVISAEGTGAADAFWYAPHRKRHQEPEGHQRQDRGVLVARLVDQPDPAATREGGRREPQAGADRRRARDLHAGDDRPDRRRLVGAAVRAEGFAGEARSRSSRAAATPRRSGRRPSASMSPTPTR